MISAYLVRSIILSTSQHMLSNSMAADSEPSVTAATPGIERGSLIAATLEAACDSVGMSAGLISPWARVNGDFMDFGFTLAGVADPKRSANDLVSVSELGMDIYRARLACFEILHPNIVWILDAPCVAVRDDFGIYGFSTASTHDDAQLCADWYQLFNAVHQCFGGGFVILCEALYCHGRG